MGPDESDIPSGKISIVSPLGKALLGKEVDDEVKVQTPGGSQEIIRVLKICLNAFISFCSSVIVPLFRMT